METSLISLYWNGPEDRYRVKFNVFDRRKTFTFESNF
jgi:hypothetical protein